MSKPSVVAVCLVLLVARAAEATCMELDDGCSVCCAGPEDDCSTSCPQQPSDWSPDAATRWELGVSSVAALNDDAVLGAGGRISVAYHRLYPFRERVFGNQLGVELGAERVWIDGAPETRLSATPIGRVARASRWRTPSVFGVVVPEVGASLRDGAPAQIFFRWSLFPVDVRVTSWLAIELEPLTAAVGIGGGTRTWLSSSIGVRLVWDRARR